MEKLASSEGGSPPQAPAEEFQKQAQSHQQASAGPTDVKPTLLPASMRATKSANDYNHKGRNLIICLDGTGDKFDSDNSNIVHLVSSLKKDDSSQVTYYQSGIGTYDGGGLSNGISAGFDMAVGSGLGVHVRDAYQFIMQTYRERDKICLFGFSRGAYTARCLAGMLHKVGLLPAHNKAQIPFAYQFYKDESAEGWDMSKDFKKTFCQNVNVHFLGLFDSVNSVGFIPRKLPLSSTPDNQPAYFRHAMALDEHRAKFKVCRFKHAVSPGEQIAEYEGEKGPSRTVTNATGTSKASTTGSVKSSDLLADGGIMDVKRNTDVLEVWFMGAHADVGGGAVKNEERHKLSQIPLRWMIRQCFECDTGILFHTKVLADLGLDVHMLWPKYIPLDKPTSEPPPSLMEQYENGTLGPIARRTTHLRVMPPPKHSHEAEDSGERHHDVGRVAPEGVWTPEQVEDYFDAMSPINDQLVQAKGWWILEFWPIKVRVRKPNTAEGWQKKVRMNLGRYRYIPESDPNWHWTVKLRVEKDRYKVRTRALEDAVWREVV